MRQHNGECQELSGIEGNNAKRKSDQVVLSFELQRFKILQRLPRSRVLQERKSYMTNQSM